jgi:hypothetical protein
MVLTKVKYGVEVLVPREMNEFVIPQRHETAIIEKIYEASNVV